MKLPMQVEFILNRLQDNGHEAYIVGGCVRDMILGITPHDYDICTSAKPEQVIDLFNDCTVVNTGIKHGTVTVILKAETDDKFKIFEITTYRIDGVYKDNRHPETVEYTSDLTQDLARRDFTINAMAYNYPNGLIDPFCGLDDIENKVIRCVGRPEDRFNEDALRILRGIRFAFRFGYDIDTATFSCMDSHRHLLKNISKERVCDELTKILSNKMFWTVRSHKASKKFEFFVKIVNLLSSSPVSIDKNELAINLYDSGDNLILRLALLFRNTNVLEVLKAFRFSNEIAFAVNTTIHYGNIVLDKVPDEDMESQDIIHLARKLLCEIKNHDPDLICRYAIVLTHQYKKSQNLQILRNQIKKCKANNDVYSLQYLAVNGNDLIAEGYEGRQIGDVLSALLDMVIYDNVTNTKPELLQAARNLEVSE